MRPVPYHRFDVRFAAGSLQEDLLRVAPEEWVAHYNTGDYDGSWDGVALRAVSGIGNPLLVAPSAEAVYSDTALLARCPALRAVLDWFRCPLRSARLLRLGAGASVREHCDPQLGVDDGEVRVHVPVVTNPDVEFYVDGRRLVLRAGELWYLDLSRPHRIKNRGTTERVHLVIDCVVNDWLRALIPCAGEGGPLPATIAPESNGFEAFRALVFQDVALQEQLREPADLAAFRALVVQLGQQRGYAFDDGDVEDALRACRRAWLERTLP